MEGDRAFAQPQDHRVAAGFDALGDGDLALAAEQLDRAHLAQVHPHRIVGALGGFLLLFGNVRLLFGASSDASISSDLGVLAVLVGRASSSLSTMLTPISEIADMMSSIWSDDIWSCGSASLSSS